MKSVSRIALYTLVLLAIVVPACGGSGDGTTPPPVNPPPPTGQWTVVWSDEFDATNGSAPSSSNWVLETGGGGWGNNELESYTNRTDNASIQDGNLVITAKKEPFTGTDGIPREYTSARMKTQGKVSWKYGKMEARIKIPYGQGIWPAFWMLGDDITTVGWPGSGEIDIMENIGKEPSTVHGTIHGPGYSGGNAIGKAYSISSGAFADDYHVYAIEWEPNVIRWYVDGTLYSTLTPTNLPSGSRWVYDHNFFIILNLAVGGNWPGNPDGTTVFPQQMLVDYVRVYQRQ
jgi:beta-glucanase (GH16 family)